MNIHLVVTQAFGLHAKGDIISDQSEIQSILASNHAGHVVSTPMPCIDQRNATPEKEA